MTLSVRVLGAGDQPVWRALRIEALDRFPTAFLTTGAEQRARSSTADIAMLEQGAWRGLFSGRDLIGQAALLPMAYAAARHRMEIGGFYVTPDHQGAGAAQILLEALEGEAASHGALQLELSVAADNARAIRFYERNGFERFGTQPRAIIFEGEPQDDYYYVKFLDRSAV